MMTKIIAILVMVTLTARAVIVIPTAAEQAATNWTALSHRLNGSGATITNHVSYRFVLKLSNGFLGCAVGSNKVAFAAHIGSFTSVWFDDVNDVAHTTYAVTTTATTGDFGIATLSDVLPRWAAVDTNSVIGSNVVGWGWGKGYDTNGTPTSPGGIRTFPLSESAYATRWGPFRIWSTDPATSSNYRIYTDTTETFGTNTAVTGGDSSGPLFIYNAGATNWQFVGNWKSSAATTSEVEDGNTQIANSTATANAFLASELPNFTGYDPAANAPFTSSSARSITTRTLRIGP